MRTPTFHILIVDDSPEDRERYRRYLAAPGSSACRFTEAESGEEGLQLCRADRPDCILLDYSLPDLDGLDFLAHLTVEFGKEPIPVVMLTGKGNETVAVEALKRGAEDYLVKGSLARDGIRQAVQAAIDKADLRRQLDAQRSELEQSAAALRASEALYRELADAMPQIVWTARPDGFRDYYSRQWSEFSGSPPDLTRDAFEPFVHPDDVARRRAA